jgi:tetratricopeptide (TPR) repeat protein
MGFPDILARTLNTKGIIALTQRRPEEAQALLSHAVKIATEHDLTDLSLGAYFNLAESLGQGDRYDDAIAIYERARALARRVGDRPLEWATTCELVYLAMATGRWDQAMDLRSEVDLAEPGALLSCFVLPIAVVPILAARGQFDEAQSLLASFDEFRTSADLQTRGAIAAATSALLGALGRLDDAINAAREALAANPGGPSTQTVKIALVAGTEAALAAKNVRSAEEFLDVLGELLPGEIAPFLRAQDLRLRSRLAAARGDDAGVETGFRSAVGSFRELGVPFWMAVTLLEHVEWLGEHHRPADAERLLTEAREVFERLGARRWIERLEQVSIPVDSTTAEAAS